MAAALPLKTTTDGGFSRFKAGDFLPITSGGTGAIDGPGARIALGLEIGVNVQGYDADLAAIAAIASAGILIRTGTNTWDTVTIGSSLSLVGTTLSLGTINTTSNITITKAEPTLVLSNTGNDSWLIAAGGGGNISNGYLGFRNTTDGVTPFAIAPDAIGNTLILSSTGISVTGTIGASGRINANASDFQIGIYDGAGEVWYLRQYSDTLAIHRNSTGDIGQFTAAGLIITGFISASGGAVTSDVSSGYAFLASRIGGDRIRVTPSAAGSGATIDVVNAAESDYETLSMFGKLVQIHTRTGVGTTALTATFNSSGITVAGSVSATQGSFKPTGNADGTVYISSSGTGVYQRLIFPDSSNNQGIQISGYNNSILFFDSPTQHLLRINGVTQIDVTSTVVAMPIGVLSLGSDSVAGTINSIGDTFVLNVDSNNNTGGTPNIQLKTGGVEQLRINKTASATRYVTITGSNGGNPAIGVSAGLLAISNSMVVNNVVTFTSEYDNGNSSTAATITLTNGSKQKITLNNNTTLTVSTTGAGIGNYQIRLIQDGSGGRTVTWAGLSGSRWLGATSAPAINDAIAGETIVSIYFDGTNMTQSLSKIGAV